MKKIQTKNSKSDFISELRVVGINYKGYGQLPKYVMLDPDLTIEAKGIYAYFCSYAGGGNSAFPGRDKILADLKISKNAYYRHFNLLKSQGYILVKQNNIYSDEGMRFKKNIYVLVSNPKKFKDKLENGQGTLEYAQIAFSGLAAIGYGTIPKAVMLDNRLPLKAKAIYAYLCSFTGSGNSAFPKKSNMLFHLSISEKAYYKYYKLLTSLNYITVIQRHVNGKLSVNDYYLNDMPDETKATKKIVKTISIQGSHFRDTQKNLNSKGLTQQINQSFSAQKGDTQNNDTQNRDTNNNNLNNNNLSINLQKTTEKPQPTNPFDDYLKILKINVQYDTLCHDLPHSKDTILEMLNIAADTLCCTKPYIRINDENKPTEIIKGQLLKLTADHIKYIENCMNKTTTKIHNIKAYLLSALYNSTFSINNYYRAEVKNDSKGF